MNNTRYFVLMLFLAALRQEPCFGAEISNNVAPPLKWSQAGIS